MAQDKPFNIYDYKDSYYGIPVVNPQDRTSPFGRAMQSFFNETFLPNNMFDYSRGLLQEGLDKYITRGGYFRDQTVPFSNAMLSLNNELLMAKTHEDVMDIAKRFRNLENSQNPSPVIPNGVVPQAISSDQFEQQDEYAMQGLLGGNVVKPQIVDTASQPIIPNQSDTPTPSDTPSRGDISPQEQVVSPSFDGVAPQATVAQDRPTPQSKRSVEQEKSLMEKARKEVATDDFRDKLIIGLEGLTHSPNRDLIRSAQGRIDARRSDERKEKLRQEDAIKRNKTADYILKETGDEDLARLVADGLISGGDALQEFKSSQAEMKRLTASRDSVIAKSGFVLQAIDKSLDILRSSPVTSAGFLGAAASLGGIIPETAAVKLNAALETIRANIGFKELNDMRQSSKTGGALGNVTVRELELLQSTMVSLDPDIGAQGLFQNLQQLKNVFNGVLAKVEASNYEAKRAAGVVPQLESQYSSLQRLV